MFHHNIKKNRPVKQVSLWIIAILLLSFNASDISHSPLDSSQMASVRVGSMAPELSFKDPEGNMRNLSDLRGKIVMLDFWASWCGPCRQENPSVVKTYHQFKDANFKSGKGFEIFSVSLDQSKGRWIKAIEQDKLAWDNHVSDLRGWSSRGAAIYGVNSIPRTFLIDGKGKIIGMNLRGQQIAHALKALQK